MATYYAFPTDKQDVPGMMLRDYFAASALAGMLAAATSFRSHTVEEAAALAYKFAEAMVLEKEKVPDAVPQPIAKPAYADEHAFTDTSEA